MKSLSFGRASAVLFAALLGIAMLHPQRAAAEGAIAVGEPKDVAKDGYAYGYSTGKPDLKSASTEALETCRKPGNGKSDAGTQALQDGWDLHQRVRRRCDGSGAGDAGRRLGDRRHLAAGRRPGDGAMQGHRRRRPPRVLRDRPFAM